MNHTSPHILIAEDEKALQNILSKRFEEQGFVVSTADNGRACITMATEQKPDAIILDVLMPEMNGIECLKAIRDTSWGKEIPILVLTNLTADDSDLVKAIFEKSPNFYLVKMDWSIDSIIEKVHEMLA